MPLYLLDRLSRILSLQLYIHLCLNIQIKVFLLCEAFFDALQAVLLAASSVLPPVIQWISPWSPFWDSACWHLLIPLPPGSHCHSMPSLKSRSWLPGLCHTIAGHTTGNRRGFPCIPAILTAPLSKLRVKHRKKYMDHPNFRLEICKKLGPYSTKKE